MWVPKFGLGAFRMRCRPSEGMHSKSVAVWPRWPFRMRCRPSERMHSLGAGVWPRWSFRVRCRPSETVHSLGAVVWPRWSFRMRCRPSNSMHSMGAVVWFRWPFQHRCPSTVSHSPTDARSSKVNNLAVRHPNIAGAAAVLAACRRGVVSSLVSMILI